MSNAFYQLPKAINEPVKPFGKDSVERKNLLAQYEKMYNQSPIDIPMYIGSEEVRTQDKRRMSPPHEHGKTLGHFNYGDASHVQRAIESALQAKAPQQGDHRHRGRAGAACRFPDR